MVTIKECFPNELNIIQDIAYKTWPVTYALILSDVQLDYMLQLFYSLDGLNKNLEDGHHFLLALEDGNALGFASYVNRYQNQLVTRIPKIYILPEAQGRGIGKLLIDEVARQATKAQSQKLSLNVNRSNNAVGFYKKIGFEITGEEDIKLDHGYLMEDFIMEKQLS